MPPAANLDDCANDVSLALLPHWRNNTLEAAMVAFATDLDPEFPDGTPNNQPIGNWIGVIGSFAPSVLDFVQDLTRPSIGVGTITTYRLSVQYVYRLVKIASALLAQGLISSTQATAIVNSFNTNFTP